MQKPMLTVDELITHMKNKGITFTVMSEDEARAYLIKNNNYFKLSAYRKNYAFHFKKDGRKIYEHLDFAYLVELARIDVQIRHVLLGMCLDIEHALKVEILKAIENNAPKESYSIVADYNEQSNILPKKIENNIKNPYCGGLIKKYKNDMPIWAFLEIISFGDLLYFGQYLEQNDKWNFPVDSRSLDRVRQIRNACAHNNCIISELCSKTLFQTPLFLTEFLKSFGFTKNSMHKKMSNPRISQIVHVFYIYSLLVKNGKTRDSRIIELQNIINNRIPENKAYFTHNEKLISIYDFLKTLINQVFQKNT